MRQGLLINRNPLQCLGKQEHWTERDETSTTSPSPDEKTLTVETRCPSHDTLVSSLTRREERRGSYSGGGSLTLPHLPWVMSLTIRIASRRGGTHFRPDSIPGETKNQILSRRRCLNRPHPRHLTVTTIRGGGTLFGIGTHKPRHPSPSG